MSDADFEMRLRTKAKHYKMLDGKVARLLLEAADYVATEQAPAMTTYDAARCLDQAGITLLPWQRDKAGL